MSVKLYDYQLDALSRMSNGCILCGGVGSGKSITGISYYFKRCGGNFDPFTKMTDPIDLYIITTARKRDTLEWNFELAPFCMSPKKEYSLYKDISITIDSWNNIEKYKDVKDAFFIFDEQRVVGKGSWVKSFLKIAKKNEWILLSATPGDTWTDYIPVFIANGFYRNRTEFYNKHVIWAPTKYPKVERFVETGRLIRLRNKILVDMNFSRLTESHNEYVSVDYDISTYKSVMRNRWDPYKNEPIVNASELCYVLRKIVNSDESRLRAVKDIVEKHEKVIIFYCYDYELELLKSIKYDIPVEVAEWNGHRHQPIPESGSWVYLCNYTSCSEGWNCIRTDTMIFYSQTYSYKTLMQAMGRIDRLNTPFKDLYYYHLKSKSSIDITIGRALKSKKRFNEQRFFAERDGYK